MRKYLLLPFILLSVLAAAGQQSFKRNSLYGEMFGNGIGMASLHYERQLKDHPGFGFRLGIGGFFENKFQLSIPAGINYLFHLRNNRSFIDAGAGITWSSAVTLKTYKQELATGPGE